MKKGFRNKYKRENILRHLNDRSIGTNNSKPTSIENLEKHLPYFWKKQDIEAAKHNKIFASQWISNDSVVYGTKCNKLYYLNVDKGKSYEIPLIEGVHRKDQVNAHSNEPSSNFGIHAIKKNYTETLMATGAENVNSVGIYKMPEFQPMVVLENFHSDAIFDICWLDDSHVATCSRDSKMGIWCVNPEMRRPAHFYYSRSLEVNDPEEACESVIGAYHRPLSQMCLDYNSNRFRAMEYLQSTNRLLIATMSNKLYSLDPVRNLDECGSGSDVISFKTAIQEMVAIRRWPAEPSCFAVGGQARFAIYDSRKQGEGMNILALNQSAGIRSLAFKDAVISYGTAEGHINFFDLRAKRHLDLDSLTVNGGGCTANHGGGGLLQLRMEGAPPSTRGPPLSPPGPPLQAGHSQTAIYTHEYDPTRTRMFAAGGPIAACHSGQAACLFH